MSTPRAIAYLATSVDGFIAGPDDDLSWLTDPRTSGMPFAADAWAARAEGGLGFDALLSSVGCLLMGRRTYDAVRAMDVPWPYGDLPVHVATTRPLAFTRSSADAGGAPAGVTPTPIGLITAVSGSSGHLVSAALDRAQGKSVYVDGGTVVRDALAAGVLDDLIVTIIPTVLGSGTRLFDATVPRTDLTVVDVNKFADGFIQVHYRCT